jgi:hypothetical protein
MRHASLAALVAAVVIIAGCATATEDQAADAGIPHGGGDAAVAEDAAGGAADGGGAGDAGAAADTGDAVDAGAPIDAGGDDAGTPADGGGGVDAGDDDGGTAADGGGCAGAAGPYEQCAIGGCDCQAGLDCVGGRATPTQYGMCTATCASETDCPASPAGNPIGCDTQAGLCAGGCATTADCPAWLECVASQMCLPPLVTQGTKTPGQSCTSHDECATGQCAQGENTQLHCNPGCATDADCASAAPGAKGTCAAVGGAGFNICIWWCYGGAVCPGDLDCSGGVVCQ